MQAVSVQALTQTNRLAKGFGINRRKGHVIQATDETCKTGTQLFGSKIDYFVVSDAFHQAGALAKTVDGYKFNPHVPVKMELESDPRDAHEQVMAGPKRFPPVWPIGCQVEPRKCQDQRENAENDMENEHPRTSRLV